MRELISDLQIDLYKEALIQARRLNVLIWVAISNSQEFITFMSRQADGEDDNDLDIAKKRGRDHSKAKARAAASFGKPSGLLEREIGRSIEIVQKGKLMNIRGGLPIQKEVDGEIIHYGGLGISGGSDYQDLLIAYNALKKSGYFVDPTWLN